ncbi:hypothetical protein K493DRAFT_299358 [Basidiobolus meristosporus CBS 931.73]|uniref:Uncharacterized protein n=1 Tax=Basidiobolus meristosporus CBS 931.73 TaxID=1314790 RepID=A0A1Y1YNN9_9FUNG|nr:hypothetical protein K493DRAFT_299358 [Basidiobolus meristosporus CBS 931.73]|eukprot:ORX99443.1 hypothetical protein K493DRAFT_299358 [Basidiobolus meristosporus CBS 931.73]
MPLSRARASKPSCKPPSLSLKSGTVFDQTPDRNIMCLNAENLLSHKIALVKPNLHTLNEPQASYDIGESIRRMDTIYRTSFQTWIKDSNNAHCIGIKLRRLACEMSVEKLAKAIKWIAEGWPEGKCRVLFSQITANWPEDRRAGLAELLLKTTHPLHKLKGLLKLPPLRNLSIIQDSSTISSKQQSTRSHDSPLLKFKPSTDCADV